MKWNIHEARPKIAHVTSAFFVAVEEGESSRNSHFGTGEGGGGEN